MAASRDRTRPGVVLQPPRRSLRLLVAAHPRPRRSRRARVRCVRPVFLARRRGALDARATGARFFGAAYQGHVECVLLGDIHVFDLFFLSLSLMRSIPCKHNVLCTLLHICLPLSPTCPPLLHMPFILSLSFMFLYMLRLNSTCNTCTNNKTHTS